MKNYRSLVVPRPNFKYSVNLQHDLFDADRLKQYIPLGHSVYVLNELFSSIVESEQTNSRILYGSYGTGKSHLVTVLASILGKGLPADDYGSYELFCHAIDAVDHSLSIKIECFIKDSQPYLIVPVLASGLEQGIQFEQIIYRSLIRALRREHLNITFQDTYIEAEAIIRRWLDPENKEARSRCQRIFYELGVNAEQLLADLHNYDLLTLQQFEEVFQEMTFGTSYQPQLRDLSQNLDETNLFLNHNGYRGIIFIFDEFGRYLEDYMESFKIKHLQDLAEYCDHCPFDNHLLLVSHQDISLYIRPNDLHKLDEWKKVEGRFRPVSMVPDREQLLKIIQYVIPKKEPDWTRFQQQHQMEFKQVSRDAATLDMFSILLSEEEFYQGIVLGAFPLNPMVAFMLERLSKKVAQNERSIFTFLAGNEPFSLGNFLDSQSLNFFNMLTADWLYDYFAPLLENQQRGPVYFECLQLRTAFNKLDRSAADHSLKRRILKAMVLINIINDYSNLKPIADVFRIILNEKEQDIEAALGELEQDKIIIYMRHYGYYRFFDASSIDVEQLIDDAIKQQNGSDFYIEILNREFIPIPVLPEEYNYRYKMTRYYLPRFALINQIADLKIEKEEKYRDGLIIYLLTDQAAETMLNQLGGDNMLYVLREDSWDLVKEVKRYAAIQYLLNNQAEIKERDPLAAEELQARWQESQDYIKDYINAWNEASNSMNLWVYDGTVLYKEINSRQSLSDFLSNKLANTYPKTMLVNNEMVNKNQLSSVMRGFRKEIVNKVLWGDLLDDCLGYRILSGQQAFWRSVAVRNGLIPEFKQEDELSEEDRFRHEISREIMDIIQDFLNHASQDTMSLYLLYDSLKRPPYGLRDGYIPILLAIAMRPYLHNIYIDLQGQDQTLDSNLLERILATPREFSLSIDHWGAQKEQYITALEQEFAAYIDGEIRKKHRLMALHKAMLDYYRTVSRLGRNTQILVSPPAKQFRNLMEKNTTDYRKFFFNDMPLSLGFDYNALSKQVSVIIKELDSVVDIMNIQIKNSICQVFGLEPDRAVFYQLNKLYLEKWQPKAEYAFHFLSNRFLDMLADMEPTLPEADFISRLTELLTGFEVSYWGDRQMEELHQALQTIWEQLEGFVPLQENSLTIGNDDRKKTLSISLAPLTQNQEILKRMIIRNIDDFAQSLSYEQKQQVIIEVLRKYI